MPRLTRAESVAATRQKLVEAATDTFTSVGFVGATVEGIAEAAGYSRGAFYAHFGSKDDILLAIVEAQTDGVTPLFLDRIGQAADPDEAIEAVVALLVERGRSQGLARAVMDALHEERHRGGSEGRYTRLVTANWHVIGEALRRFFPGGALPCEPDELVAILVALTYNPVVGEGADYQIGRLARVTLRGLMGRLPTSDVRLTAPAFRNSLGD